MVTCQRCSPVFFESTPAHTEQRDGWEVVLQYNNEGKGPFLIDLSHRAKWDVQDANLSQIQPRGVTIPETPGQCVLQKGLLINRMNQTQADVWHLSGDSLATPQELAYTDVTEGFALFALVGRGAEVFSIIEKITPLDILSPEKKPPFLIQGPVLHVPCQIVVLGEKDNISAVLIACSRGYGQSLAEELLDAGAQMGLRPAGEIAFCNWFRVRFG
ncbi:MAG: hypothetical protein V3W43_01480 [Desulfatiglandaceae bacterium]